MAGIQTRLAAAVNMDNLEDKITASDSIRVETNIMMQKLEVAMLQRYQDTHQKMYGFKDEKQNMNILKRNIKSLLGQYQKKSPASPAKINVAGGNLFAQLAALKQQQQQEQE